MASSNPRGPSYPSSDNTIYNQRRYPLSINTSNAGALANPRGHRFSYVETPVEMNEPQIPSNRFAPDSTPIQESPASASFQSPQYQQYGYGIGNAQESSRSHKSQMESPQSPRAPQATTQNIQRTSSPYGIPEPTQIHPAYYAPIAPSSLSPQFQQQHPSSPPLSHQPPSPQPQQQQFNKANRVSTLKSESDEKHTQDIKPPLRSPTIPDSNSPRLYQQPIFSPGSLAGPNGAAPDLHQPGQVLHPNMTFPSTTGGKMDWNHGMCECSGDIGTCITGVFCPCILDSRTAYRLNRRSEKQDPTDLLGFKSCNSRCTVMSIFGICGLCCFLPLTLRTRIRHAYKLQGNVGSDILHSCCCCCCTAIQNEREVTEREDLLRVNAGPAQTQTQYRAGVGQGMVYAPQGTF